MNSEEIINDVPDLQRFLIVGIITSEDFQKSRYALLKLHKSFPNIFDCPDIRPMLDVEWNQFITKHRRRLGNGLWAIQNRVAIYKNEEFLGDFNDLKEFIWKKWKYVFNQDWHDLASRHLIEYFEEKTNNYRQLVYLTIAINCKVIGSLLFELYNDVVPLTCENFLNRCTNELNGYVGAPVHRIVENSWIQLGGYELAPKEMICENYVVPHDRRGVLSMCNNGAHRDNSTQFFVTLESTPWMDYKYVAFGQLLHGDDVLKVIENVPTYYQAPTQEITIVKCGEYQTRAVAKSTDALYTADEIDQWKEIQHQMDIISYIQSFHGATEEGSTAKLSYFDRQPLKGSVESILSQRKLKSGTYSLKTDLKSYAPFSHLPDLGSDDDEGNYDYDICGPDIPIKKLKDKLYNDDLSPSPSDCTL